MIKAEDSFVQVSAKVFGNENKGGESPMKQIKIKAYAKINLCIDVLGKLPNGYHQVEMVMQQVDLFDTVTVSWGEPAWDWEPPSQLPDGAGSAEEGCRGPILLTVSRADLPVNENNIAFRAARLMKERFAERIGEKALAISVDLKKRIPVAAGLAGGSADGAAVIHGLNRLWELNLPLEQLMELGGELGSDIPFCILGQAALNPELGFAASPEPANASGPLPAACVRSAAVPTTCALATGTGKTLKSVLPLRGFVVLCKPEIGVSTAEVYGGLRLSEVTEHPRATILADGIREGNLLKVKQNMKNLLESVTLARYPKVARTKAEMELLCKPYHTLMSGSGPTVFGLFFNQKKARTAYETMKNLYSETYLAKLL